MENYFVFGIYFLLCLMCIPYSIQYKNSLKNKKIINISLFIFIFLLGVLRNPQTGADTYAYFLLFESKENDLSQLLLTAKTSFESEKGYYILSSIFNLFLTNGSIWLAISLLFFLVPCAILIYKESECEPISYLYLVTSYIYIFTWQALRQNFAIGICIWAIMCLKNKKWIQFGILLILAFSFHRSSFMFILSILAFYIKPDWKYFLIIVIVFFISFINPYFYNQILLFFFSSSDLSFAEKMNGYATSNALGGNLKNFAVALFLFVICYLFKDELYKKNKFNQFLINMSFLGCIFQAMSVSIVEFFRLAFYFSIFNMILIPNLFQILIEKYYKYHFELFLIIFLIIVFFLGNKFDYWFIWEKYSW